MRVLVVGQSPVPLREGGAERLYRGLLAALGQAGHTADMIKLPAREHTLGDLAAAYEAFGSLDLSHADAVISGRYPAWMVEHHHHVLWMLHPLRGLYDTYPEAVFVDDVLPDLRSVRQLVDLSVRPSDQVDPSAIYDAVFEVEGDLGAGSPVLAIPSPLARRVVHQLDAIALSPRRIRRHAAISATVADRAGYFPGGVHPMVLHPPLEMSVATESGDDGHFLAVSRLERPKRVDLVIEAFRRARHAEALVIAGEGLDEPRLRDLAADDDRIRFAGRVSDDELGRLYATCRAVVFAPRDEDFGYITLEAMAHGKAVITTSDSGGPVELVSDQRTGLLTAPDAESIAAAIDELAIRPDRAAEMGAAGREMALDTSWERTVEALLERPRAARVRRQRHVVAVSTYPLHPRRGGGPLRGYHLLAELCRSGDVTAEAISTTVEGRSVTRHHLADELIETVVPLSGRHERAETDIRLVTGTTSITDISVALMWRATPSLHRELANALERADAVVLVQPYLEPAVEALAPGMPRVYDAHNVEAALKADLLPDNEAGRWLLEHVEQVEAAACGHSELLTAVTPDDLADLHRRYPDGTGHDLVVPNGVAVDEVEFVTGERRRARRGELVDRLGLPSGSTIAVFVGSGHNPNIEAGRDLLDHAAEHPDVTFLLAGRHCNGLRRPHLPPNTRLLGEVAPDLLDLLLGGADVALNPMRAGGGSNLKLVTYLAAGLPVVSSGVGARGVDAAAAGVVTADLAGLGQALAQVRVDAEARGAAGREWVAAHADWAAIGARFAEAVHRSVLS